MAAGKIKLVDIELPLFIGCYTWEEQHVQYVQLSMELELDALLEDGRPVVDYACIASQLQQKFGYKRFVWVEEVAQQVMEYIKRMYPTVQVHISVYKNIVVQGRVQQAVIEIQSA